MKWPPLSPRTNLLRPWGRSEVTMWWDCPGSLLEMLLLPFCLSMWSAWQNHAAVCALKRLGRKLFLQFSLLLGIMCPFYLLTQDLAHRANTLSISSAQNWFGVVLPTAHHVARNWDIVYGGYQMKLHREILMRYDDVIKHHHVLYVTW